MGKEFYKDIPWRRTSSIKTIEGVVPVLIRWSDKSDVRRNVETVYNVNVLKKDIPIGNFSFYGRGFRKTNDVDITDSISIAVFPNDVFKSFSYFEKLLSSTAKKIGIQTDGIFDPSDNDIISHCRSNYGNGNNEELYLIYYGIYLQLRDRIPEKLKIFPDFELD